MPYIFIKVKPFDLYSSGCGTLRLLIGSFARDNEFPGKLTCSTCCTVDSLFFTALFATAESVLGLPAGSITSVRALPAAVVLAVLQYHVTEGHRAAHSVVPPIGSRKIETLPGASFLVNPSGMIYTVGNTYAITKANIPASNGIIHLIDAVVLPVTTKQRADSLLSF